MNQMIYEELTKEEEILLSRIRNLEDGIIHISSGKNELRIEIEEQTVQFCQAAKCGLGLMIWQQSDQNLPLNGTMPEMESLNPKC